MKNNKSIMLALAICCVAASSAFGRTWCSVGIGIGVPTPPVVVSTPVVSTAPVVSTIPSYSYGYYNNVYCPTYSGYYWYNNAWTWGGAYGVARPPMPLWRPHHYHHHYAPPRPPIHHGGFHHSGPRPGGFHHGGGFHGGPRGGFHHRR